MPTANPNGVDLPRLWFSAGGNERLWGDAGTYTPVDYDKLPPLAVDGSFRWLTAPADGMSCMPLADDPEAKTRPHEKLAARAREATALGLSLPEELIRFLNDATLVQRVPSCTACYFDIGDKLVEVPGHKGPARLLRFMSDQQCCLLWFVLLEPGLPHRIVVAGPSWPDEEDGGDSDAESLDDAMVPDDPAICADNFEEFIKRFWIENTLWWSVNEGSPPIEGELKGYVDAVARRR